MKLTSVAITRLQNHDKLEGEPILGNDLRLVQCQDDVVIEEPLHVLLKSYTDTLSIKLTLVMTTMRTPGNDIELVKGWLNTQSFILTEEIETIERERSLKSSVDDSFHSDPSPNDLTSIVSSEANNRVIIKAKAIYRLNESKLTRLSAITSSCGICGDTEIDSLSNNSNVSPIYALKLNLSDLWSIAKTANQNALLFRATGGSHAATFFAIKNNQIHIQQVALREDVGRHNALDKLIGAHSSEQMQQFALLLSGRVSADLMQKVICAGIPVVISIGAPSSLAIELAESVGIILIGFVKKSTCNVYAGKQQLDLNQPISLKE